MHRRGFFSNHTTLAPPFFPGSRPHSGHQVAAWRCWRARCRCAALSGQGGASAPGTVVVNSDGAAGGADQPAAPAAATAASAEQGTPAAGPQQQQQQPQGRPTPPQALIPRGGAIGADGRARPPARALLPADLRSTVGRPPCAQCGGKGTVPGAQGPMPCTVCQPWRRRPDYQPGTALLSSRDLDLSPLDPPAANPASSLVRRQQRALPFQPAPQPVQQQAEASDGAALPGSLAGAGPPAAGPAPGAQLAPLQLAAWGGVAPAPPWPAAGGAATKAAGAAAGPPAEVAAPKKRRASQRMTEEKREAIRQGALRKGSHSEEHRRNIARAMREAHAKNPALRHATRGVKKSCGYCGAAGHTRRSCPQLAADREAAAAAEAKALAAASEEAPKKPGVSQLPEARRRKLAEALRQAHARNPAHRLVGLGKPKTCAYCGVKGHTRRHCAQLRTDAANAGCSAEELLAAKAQRRERRPPTCSNCGQQGHTRRYCPALQREAAGGVAEATAEVPLAPLLLPEAAAGEAARQAELGSPQGAELVRAGTPELISAAPAEAAAAAASAAAAEEQAAPPAGDKGLTVLPEAGPPPAQPQVRRRAVAAVAEAATQPQPSAPAPAAPDESPTLPAGLEAAGSASGSAGVPATKLEVSGEAAAGLEEAAQAAAAADAPGTLEEKEELAAAAEAAAPLEVAGKGAPAAAVAVALPTQQQPEQQLAEGRSSSLAPSSPWPLMQQRPRSGQAPVAEGTERGAGPPAYAGVSYDDAGLPTRELGMSGMLIDPDGGLVFPMPSRQADCIAQASQAVLRAWEDGIRWQCLELPLPLNNAPAEGGWPGGIRQQYRVALPILEGLLLRLKQYEGLQGRITAEWLDKADCVGAWQSEKLAAVLFPTADTLPAVRRIENALSGQRLMLVVNPQWQVEGQIISDFGFGQARRRAEQFVRIFEDIYCLRRARVRGEEVRILKCYPGAWQVYYVQGGKEPLLLACEETKPSYQRLEELMQPIFARKANWLQQFLGWGGSEGEGPGGDPAFDPAGLTWWPDDSPQLPSSGAGPAAAATTTRGAAGDTSAAEQQQQQQQYVDEAFGASAAWPSRRDRELAARFGGDRAIPSRLRPAAQRAQQQRQQQELYAERQVGDFGWREGEAGAAAATSSSRGRAKPAGGKPGSNTQQQQQQQQEERDIITGEVVMREGPAPSSDPQPSSTAPSHPSGSPGTGVLDEAPLARDYRMQPVQQMAKWVFGSGGADEDGGAP